MKNQQLMDHVLNAHYFHQHLVWAYIYLKKKQIILIDKTHLVSIFIKVPNYISNFTEGVAFVFFSQPLLQ